jgi:serine/threonine protein kinase
MGTVWLARDLLLGREVAVKEVTGQGERVLAEARAAARIVHPNVVTVYDVVEHDSRQWIVMQHVESRTLADVITVDGPLPPERAAEIGLDLLAGLRAAHDSGVLHRDVKPGNVLLDAQGRAYLADFGIASATGDPTLTSAGTLVGAPAYMAPERIRGLPSGPESDFWSLGVTIYAAVEGTVPFDRGEPLATMTAVLTDPLPPPVNAGWLTPILLRLLDKDPAKRPPPDEIHAALAGAPLAPAIDTPLAQPTVPMPARRRRRAPMAVGAFGLAAVVGVLLFLLRPGITPPTISQRPPATPPAATSSSPAEHIAPVVRVSTRSTPPPTTTTTTSTTTTTAPSSTTTAEPTTTTTTVTTTTTTPPPASSTTPAANQTSVSPTS